MAVTNDPRFGTARWSAGGDAWPGRGGWDNLLDAITTKAVIGLQDVAANRPSPGINLRIFKATDTGRYYWDDGAQWQEISPVGGGGPALGATAFTQGGAPGVEGTSRNAARADHKHPQEPWPVKTWRTTGSDSIDFNDVPANTQTTLMALVVPSAPLGLYLVSFVVTLQTADTSPDAATSAVLPFTINNATALNSAHGAYQRTDVTPHANTVTFVDTWQNTAVENKTFRLGIVPTTTQVRFRSAGSRVSVTYMGPGDIE